MKPEDPTPAVLEPELVAALGAHTSSGSPHSSATADDRIFRLTREPFAVLGRSTRTDQEGIRSSERGRR
jgi:hypothetical protein